jgi:hypothetical protein
MEHMWNECSKMREGGKEQGERRRKGDRMDERGMEEKAKDRKGEEWGMGIKKIFFCNSFLKL